jgi:hypothetical protein
MDSEIKQMRQQKLTTVMLGSELIISARLQYDPDSNLKGDRDRAQELVLAER